MLVIWPNRRRRSTAPACSRRQPSLHVSEALPVVCGTLPPPDVSPPFFAIPGPSLLSTYEDRALDINIME